MADKAADQKLVSKDEFDKYPHVEEIKGLGRQMDKAFQSCYRMISGDLAIKRLLESAERAKQTPLAYALDKLIK